MKECYELIAAKFKEGKELLSSIEIAFEQKVSHNIVVGECKSLESRGVLELAANKTEVQSLTEEGAIYAKEGSPEAQIFAFIKSKGSATQEELAAALPSDVVAIGVAQCFRRKMVTRKEDKDLVLCQESMEDEVQDLLQKIENGDLLPKDKLQDLKRRQLIEQKTTTIYDISRGPNFDTGVQEMHDDLTAEMLANESWKEKGFKPANFYAFGKPMHCGSTHRLSRVSRVFKEIFECMSFEEMPTDQWVESSFWNFDALFQPQAHPSRDCHDTFFVKTPGQSSLLDVPEWYLKDVKASHEDGGMCGSIGYRSEWLAEEAQKNILRTHTTATSTKMLFQLAEEYKNTKNVRLPRSYYSIDRVFRNETLDATHLAEFHQVEGLVADKNISISRLIGVLSTFYESIGLTNLRFKPAFNPYTEPSMEVFGHHPVLGEIEVGNSGIFRPEMLKPMGLPDDVGVMAWGLSLERPTMIRYKIDNIRLLFGTKASYGHE
eukprot:GHVP01007084.1.p1 GENE.GHVP01007084.1~~GHVP01007084.1.p1  ORF type:complete len:490 (-),score=100.23 GHVP01007084.1:65-1534(-)